MWCSTFPFEMNGTGANRQKGKIEKSKNQSKFLSYRNEWESKAQIHYEGPHTDKQSEVWLPSISAIDMNRALVKSIGTLKSQLAMSSRPLNFKFLRWSHEIANDSSKVFACTILSLETNRAPIHGDKHTC